MTQVATPLNPVPALRYLSAVDVRSVLEPGEIGLRRIRRQRPGVGSVISPLDHANLAVDVAQTARVLHPIVDLRIV